MSEQWLVSGLREKSAQQCATDCVVTLRSHRIHIRVILHPMHSNKAIKISSSKGTTEAKLIEKQF